MPRARTSRGRRYGAGASRKGREGAMRELKRGSLRSGSGRRVRSREQAIAIGLNEARREGYKVPRPGGRSRRSGRASEPPLRQSPIGRGSGTHSGR